MDERINILIGSDINYAPYYGVMLTSLFMNNKESEFDVYLLTDSSWTDKETKKFEKLCGQYRSRFIVKVVDEDVIRKFPLNPAHHATRPTYYRLMASKLLPDTVDKIIYLDGDMIVNGSLSDLWKEQIEGYAIAGVTDSLAFDEETYTRLGFDPKYSYFNAGLELISLKYWREHNISELTVNYVAENIDRLLFLDQDVANTLLADRKKILPTKYNFQTMYLTHYFSKNFTNEFFQDVLCTAQNPVIIHYCGGVKPWQYRYWGLPYLKEWNDAYKASLWKGIIVRKPWMKYVKFCIKRLVKKNFKQTQLNEYIPEAYNL